MLLALIGCIFCVNYIHFFLILFCEFFFFLDVLICLHMGPLPGDEGSPFVTQIYYCGGESHYSKQKNIMVFGSATHSGMKEASLTAPMYLWCGAGFCFLHQGSTWITIFPSFMEIRTA
jgi:hypothetical protein